MVVKKTRKIDKKMSFSELIQTAPESAEVLFNSGMHCVGCGMATIETLEQGALAHGLDPDKLVDEINKKIEKADKTDKSKTKKKK